MKKLTLVLSAMLIVSAFSVYAGPGRETRPAPSPSQSTTMTAAAVKNPTTFVYSEAGDADSMDPAKAYDNISWTIMMNVYDRLIDYNKADVTSFIPVLATELPSVANGGISKDGRTYTFHIRQGVKFQNGDPLTAEDVAYTFKRNLVLDPNAGPNWIWYTVFFGTGGSRDDKGNITVTWPEINRAVTTSGNDVVFHLKDPYAPFLSILAATWGSIVDKKFVIANGGWDGTEATWKNYNNPAEGKETLAEIANGSGPYKLTRWAKGTEIVLDYWDGYWGPKPVMTQGIYKVIKEWSTRKLTLLQGDADSVRVDPPFYKEMENQSGLKFTSNKTININNIFFNYKTNVTDNPYAGSGRLDGNGVPPDFFADKNVRLAFASAWDEKTFLQEGAGGYASDPVTPVPDGLPYKDTSLKPIPFDMQKATEYFKKAHNGEVWNTGFKLQIAYNTGNQVRETAAKMLAENVQRINPKFQIQVVGIEWAQYLDLYRQHQLPIFIIGWAPDYPDPDDYVVPFIASWGAYSGQQSYKNAEADRLIKEAAVSTDPTVRKRDYYRVQEIYMEDVPSIAIYQEVRERFYKDWVKGNFFNPMQSTQFDTLRFITKG